MYEKAYVKLHSLASFGLWVGLCGLPMCAMCGGSLKTKMCVGKK